MPGLRSGERFEALRKDGPDVSFGRQRVTVGDGFLICGDGTNFDNGLADSEYKRGGSTYLVGSMQELDKKAVLRLDGQEGWRRET